MAAPAYKHIFLHIILREYYTYYYVFHVFGWLSFSREILLFWVDIWLLLQRNLLFTNYGHGRRYARAGRNAGPTETPTIFRNTCLAPCGVALYTTQWKRSCFLYDFWPVLLIYKRCVQLIPMKKITFWQKLVRHFLMFFLIILKSTGNFYFWTYYLLYW